MRRIKGFTLIELVMVIIILGIISTVTISRFSGSQVFNTRALYNQLLLTARLTQQTALSRSAVGDVQLLVSNNGTDWLLSVIGGTGFSTQVPAGEEVVRSGTDMVAACSSLSTGAIALAFNGEGNLASGQNTRICVSDHERTLELCISSAGYAYEGRCAL